MIIWALYFVVSNEKKFVEDKFLLLLALSKQLRNSWHRSTWVVYYLHCSFGINMMIPKVLTKEEGKTLGHLISRLLTCIPGGRYTPFMSNYRPQCFIRTADITVSLTFPEGTPGAHEKMVASFVIILWYRD